MKIEKKNLAKYVSLGLICFLLGAVYVYAQGSSQVFTISQGAYPGANAYTIWTDGTNYYSKNALGVLLYLSTDASSVFQSTTNLIASDNEGGSIFIQNGDYTMTTKWTIPGGIDISSEWALLDWTGAALNDYVIEITGNSPTRFLTETINPIVIGTTLSNLIIRGDSSTKGIDIKQAAFTHMMNNVKIEGHTHANATGLKLEGVLCCKFTNVWIALNTVGIEIINNVAETTSSNENIFSNCHIQSSTNEGVKFTSTSASPGTGGTIQIANTFDACTIENNGGYGIVGGADIDTRILNCWFEANGGDIHLTSFNGFGVAHTLIDKCYFGDNSYENLLASSCGYAKVTNCDFWGNVTYTVGSSYDTINDNRFRSGVTISSGVPANPLSIERNIGFKTRTSGPVAIGNGLSQVVVPHGLAGEPTTVEVTISGENPGSVWVTVDSTNITVNVANASAGSMYAFVTGVYLTPL